jgi:hypothetical protein
MKSSNSLMRSGLVLAIGLVSIVFAPNAGAQVQTQTGIREGQSSEVVRVGRGEVLTVGGNDLIVRMQDGSFRHFENIPESAKVTVDGKQLGIHDLKPGMKLQRTITTTTTPQIVITVETVTGKIRFVNAPLAVVLTLENGTNQSFKIPKDQKFKVNGEMVDAFGLKKGMVVTATKIVEVPVSVVSQQKSVKGTMPTPPRAAQVPASVPSQEKSVSGLMPTPPPAPPADTPLLIAEGAPTTARPETTETPSAPVTTNPTTGSYLPFIGAGILLLIIILVGAKVVRGKPQVQDGSTSALTPHSPLGSPRRSSTGGQLSVNPSLLCGRSHLLGKDGGLKNASIPSVHDHRASDRRYSKRCHGCCCCKISARTILV